MAISVVELKDKQLPPDDWLIEGLLTRRNTGFVMGQPKKASKSWLLLAAAWDMSEGLPVWGIPALRVPRPMRTVYFTQEDTLANIQGRVLNHIRGGGRVPNDRVWVIPKNLNIKLDTEQGKNLITKELNFVRDTAGPIDLVMFDPMRRIHDGEENDSSTIAKLWHRLDALHNDYGCSTLISHHTTKPPADREGYDPTDPYHGRGSGDIYGGGDAFVMVVPNMLAPDGKSWRQVTVHFESKRGEQLLPARLKVSFGTGQVTYLGESV